MTLGEELKKAVDRHGNICDKLEQMNEEAFQLEQHIAYLRAKIKKDSKVNCKGCPYENTKDESQKPCDNCRSKEMDV